MQLLSVPVGGGLAPRHLQLLDRDTGELLDEVDVGLAPDGWHSHSGQRLTTATDGGPVVLIDHSFLGPVVVAPGEDGTLNVVVLPSLGPPSGTAGDWVD